MGVKVSRLRLSVTVSYPMMVAVEVLAARNGLSVSAQAALLLRQCLAGAMESAEVQRIVKRHYAQRTREDWRQDTVVEHAMEVMYAEKAGTGGATNAALEEITYRGASDAMAGAELARPEGAE